MHLSPAKALARLASQSAPFLELFQHGTLSVEIYQPKEQDLQEPHSRDEVYVVISGQGLFQNGAQQFSFAPGDLLFVPAGTVHRFLEFTPDFATWVLFYGPEGGEGSYLQRPLRDFAP